jgi:hypothetical protein
MVAFINTVLCTEKNLFLQLQFFTFFAHPMYFDTLVSILGNSLHINVYDVFLQLNLGVKKKNPI